jgi:hypothetical protein
MDVVGLVLLAGVDVEARRMDVGARAGQHNAVDHVKQRTDVGDFGDGGKHHRDGAGDFRYRTQVALADRLDREAIFNAMRIADDTDDRPSHMVNASPKILFSLGPDSGRDHAFRPPGDQYVLPARSAPYPCNKLSPGA